MTLKKSIKPQGKIGREERNIEEQQNSQKTINEMTLSTLNVNGLNSPIKR